MRLEEFDGVAVFREEGCGGEAADAAADDDDVVFLVGVCGGDAGLGGGGLGGCRGGVARRRATRRDSDG